MYIDSRINGILGIYYREHFKRAFNSPEVALPIEYKDHRSSMKDRSTYHNGKFYVVSSA